MSRPSITSFSKADHQRLDGLLRQFRSLKRSNFEKARELFAEFRKELEQHIAWEEDVLFRLYREKYSTEGGITVLKQEHIAIMNHLRTIAEKLNAGSSETDAVEQSLLDALYLHEHKEEDIFYPAIDRILNDAERELVLSSLRKNPSSWMRL